MAELAVRRPRPRAGSCGPCRRRRGSAVRAERQGGDDTGVAPEGRPDLPMARRVPHPQLASVSVEASSFPSGLNAMLSRESAPADWPALLVRVGNGEDLAAGGDRRRDPIRLDRQQARQFEVGGVTGLLGEQLGLRPMRCVDGALALNQREDGEDDCDRQTRSERADDGVQPAAAAWRLRAMNSPCSRVGPPCARLGDPARPQPPGDRRPGAGSCGRAVRRSTRGRDRPTGCARRATANRFRARPPGDQSPPPSRPHHAETPIRPQRPQGAASPRAHPGRRPERSACSAPPHPRSPRDTALSSRSRD